MTRLAGKVALVTGGSAGIGRAAALIYAREGAKVVVSDIAVEGGEETVGKIKENGGEAVFIKANVVNDAEVKELIDKTVSTYGSIDCAFNNAGILGEMAPTADCTEENFDKVININLKGVFLCLKHEIPQMLKQGGGAIVNTASIAGLIGFPTAPAYVASKGGVVQITRVSALVLQRNLILDKANKLLYDCIKGAKLLFAAILIQGKEPKEHAWLFAATRTNLM